MNVNIIVTPGQGLTKTWIPEDTTIGQIICAFANVSTAKVMYHGNQLDLNQWETIVEDDSEIWLLGNPKLSWSPNPTPAEKQEITDFLTGQQTSRAKFQEQLERWQSNLGV